MSIGTNQTQPPPSPTRPRRPTGPLVTVLAVVAVLASVMVGTLVARADRGTEAGTPAESVGPSGRPSASPSGQPSDSGSPAPSGADSPATDSGRPAAWPGYQPLWPFAGLADAAAWQESHRSGGHQPWHLDPESTALSFTRGYLGYTGVDRVVRGTVTGREAEVAVGYRLPNGRLATAAVVHLVRLGSGSDAPWEVVGTRDTTLSVTAPAYGAAVSSPMTVGGRITGVDESLSVQVRTLGQPAPVGRVGGIPAGGQNMPWSVHVPFRAPGGAVLTVAVATGGHVAEVERFAITAVRPARPAGAAIDGDIDGDGRVDAVSFPALGTLRVRYASGLTDTVRFDATPQPGVQLLGIVDADRDGRAEVFVRTTGGASTEFASIFRYVDGRLRVVTLAGHQVHLGYGGTVTHVDSWACRPPDAPIVHWSGQSTDGRTYTGKLRSYRFDRAALVPLDTTPLSVTPDQPAPTGCGSIRLG